MGISSGIVGGIGALAGLFGGGSNQPTPPPSFQMPNMGGAANNLFGGIQGLGGFANMGQNMIGPLQANYGNLANNPYGGGFQSGANFAGGLGQMQALGQYGIGNNITGIGGGMVGMGGQLAGMGQGVYNQAFSGMPAAGQVLNTAFDPQSQLYNYLQNQNLQQTQAINAGAGLATTPYGAGTEALSNQQFNMNWQNQQLGRQLSGLQGYGQALGNAANVAGVGGQMFGAGGQLMGQGTNVMGAGQQLAAGAPGQFYQASGLPYATYNQLGNDQYANINAFLSGGSGAGNLANIENQGWQNYLQLGNQANSVANQLYGLQLQSQNQQFNQNMLLGSALGNSLYRMGASPASASPLWNSSSGSFMPGSSFMSGNVIGV